MEKIYAKIVDYIIEEGKRIEKRKGDVPDIGTLKRYLTEEDLRIERGLKKIIKNYDSSHELFAEEENCEFPDTEHVWVADPISGTKTFIEGSGNFAVAVSHCQNGKAVFSAVFDPIANELFSAFAGAGAFLNGKRIFAKSITKHDTLEILFHYSRDWKDAITAKKLFDQLMKFRVYRNKNSSALNFCHVACGRYDGFVALSKDPFCELITSLILREAGGKFFNFEEKENFSHQERTFFGGNKKAVKALKPIIKSLK